MPTIMDLPEFAPVGGRASSRRDWRRFERFSEIGEPSQELERRDLDDAARAGWTRRHLPLARRAPHPRTVVVFGGLLGSRLRWNDLSAHQREMGCAAGE
jgi:hypothetical protein